MHQKKRHTKQSLQNADRSFLGNLGLSKGEIQIYNVMGKTGEPFSAQRIASEIMIFPSAVYRIFRIRVLFLLDDCSCTKRINSLPQRRRIIL